MSVSIQILSMCQGDDFDHTAAVVDSAYVYTNVL